MVPLVLIFRTRIGSKAYNQYSGSVLLPVPAEYYPDARLPEVFHMSRVAYEPFLRNLVKRHCPNVRFVQGTVTGLNLAPGDIMRVDSVLYRVGMDMRNKEEIAAELVVGEISA
jgi:hypothetical protein